MMEALLAGMGFAAIPVTAGLGFWAGWLRALHAIGNKLTAKDKQVELALNARDAAERRELESLTLVERGTADLLDTKEGQALIEQRVRAELENRGHRQDLCGCGHHRSYHRLVTHPVRHRGPCQHLDAAEEPDCACAAFAPKFLDADKPDKGKKAKVI